MTGMNTIKALLAVVVLTLGYLAVPHYREVSRATRERHDAAIAAKADTCRTWAAESHDNPIAADATDRCWKELHTMTVELDGQ
jgi:hypothetical protein